MTTRPMVDRSPPNDATTRLLRDAQAGNDSALWRLTEQMRPYLKAVVQRKIAPGLKGKFDESDVVQQSLMRAVDRFHEFQGQSVEQWQAWLVAIIGNEAKNSVRYWRQQRRDAFRELPNRPFRNRPQCRRAESSPSRVVERRERAARLLAVIEQLDPDDQQLITWRHFDNLSHGEIADRLGIKEATVRKRWTAVLKRLHHKWETS